MVDFLREVSKVHCLYRFHQLHCLAAFRRAIQLGHEGIDPGKDFMDDAHWPHCFDYMRKVCVKLILTNAPVLIFYITRQSSVGQMIPSR